jgi:hypothetical protein
MTWRYKNPKNPLIYFFAVFLPVAVAYGLYCWGIYALMSNYWFKNKIWDKNNTIGDLFTMAAGLVVVVLTNADIIKEREKARLFEEFIRSVAVVVDEMFKTALLPSHRGQASVARPTILSIQGPSFVNISHQQISALQTNNNGNNNRTRSQNTDLQQTGTLLQLTARQALFELVLMMQVCIVYFLWQFSAKRATNRDGTDICSRTFTSQVLKFRTNIIAVFILFPSVTVTSPAVSQVQPSMSLFFDTPNNRLIESAEINIKGKCTWAEAFLSLAIKRLDSLTIYSNLALQGPGSVPGAGTGPFGASPANAGFGGAGLFTHESAHKIENLMGKVRKKMDRLIIYTRSSSFWRISVCVRTFGIAYLLVTPFLLYLNQGLYTILWSMLCFLIFGSLVLYRLFLGNVLANPTKWDAQCFLDDIWEIVTKSQTLIEKSRLRGGLYDYDAMDAEVPNFITIIQTWISPQ